MNSQKIINVSVWMLTRTFVAYLVIAALVFFLVDIPSVENRIKIRRLNDTRPDMSELVSFNSKKISPDKINWQPYIKYFNLVIKFMPFEKVSRMFLGFCEYYSGDLHKTAWEHIKQAADEPPLIYWGTYNAGILAFQRGDMESSIQYLERSLSVPTELAVRGIMSSIIYRQIMAATTYNAVIPNEINTSREDLYLFLSAANYYNKNYEKSKNIALYAIQKVNPKNMEPFYFYAGVSSLAMNNVPDAMNFLSQCIINHSANPLVYRYMAEVLKSFGKEDDSRKLFLIWQSMKDKNISVFPYPERIRLRLF